MARAALAATVLSSVLIVPGTGAGTAAAASVGISDPQLLAQVSQLAGRRTEGVPSVVVEVLTADGAGISRAVSALGGTVTGSVPGEVVQATVPAAALTALANTPGARYVRAPRSAGRPPTDRAGNERTRTEAQGTGGEGAAVDITNAGSWHDAGLKGAGVKVGIIDYFTMDAWNVTEAGPKPTLGGGNMFCQDSFPGIYNLCNLNGINSANGETHGLAVAEIVKDMAPDAQLFIASVGSVSDLQAAINWFQTRGVTILTRSLGSAYDGPGDGTGPLATVVNSAVAKGMTWFNSAGNDAQDSYIRQTVTATVSALVVGGGTGQYVDFDNALPGPGDEHVDTWLRLDAGYSTCVWFDGVRWANDWYTTPRTDYSLEFYEPTPAMIALHEFEDHWNPQNSSQALKIDIDGFSGNGINNVWDANQRTGDASPLEAEDLCVIPVNVGGPLTGIVFMRVRRNTLTPVGTPDTLEIALSDGWTEFDYDQFPGTAGKAVVDSKNPGMVAVGAVDPPAGTVIGDYSSQGPTNDGRIKPDVSAPAGFFSQAYNDDLDNLEGPTFSGTSAASPVAAGMAAVLQGAGLAAPGAGTASLVRHFVTDLGAPGNDNAFGAGKVLLPPPPTAAAPATPGKYMPLALPVRGLDTRPGDVHVGPVGLTGPYAPQSIIDFDVVALPAVPDTGVSAVAINLTSTSTTGTGFLQAYPHLRAANGQTSTLNVATAGVARPNFAIVPIGVGGKISVYLQAGGNAIIDVLGYYLDGQIATATDGRFVPLAQPERWMDTRALEGAPLPAQFDLEPRKATANETILVPTLATTALPAMTNVQALVVNITASQPELTGFLRAIRTGELGATHSTLNYTTATASANTSIIPIDPVGTMSVFTNRATDIIVDVVGYITTVAAPPDTLGLFVPITPGRAYDSRNTSAFIQGETRTVQITGLTPAPLPMVPANAAGISANLTVAGPASNGFLSVYPGPTVPATSNLNYAAGKTTANAALLALALDGTIIAKLTRAGHVLIDINGYFLSGTS